jgi:hypothetical protein
VDVRFYPNWFTEEHTPEQWEIISGAENEIQELTESFRDLAQWAFGPQGLPSLEAIVGGDLSYEGRYAQSNVFLCRNLEQSITGQTFHRLPCAGDRWSSLVDKYYDVLAACPTSPLLND